MTYRRQYRLEFSHIVEIFINYAVDKLDYILISIFIFVLQINTESSKEFNEDIVESEIQESESKSEHLNNKPKVGKQTQTQTGKTLF